MTEENQAATSKSFDTLVRDRARLADGFAMLGVAGVLIGVFLLPIEVRRSLAFKTGDPSVITAFTGNFVHFSIGHLLGNLACYGLLVSLTYILSVLVNRQWQFRAAFGSLILGLPFALSFVNWLMLGPGLTIGFSGIVLGFYGYLPIVLYQYVTQYAEGSASIQYVPFVFFIGIGCIGAILGNIVVLSLVVALASLIVTLVYLRDVTQHTSIQGTGVLGKAGFTELGIVGGLLYILYPLVAFPTNVMLGGRIVNILAHFIGYSLTFIGTYVTGTVTHWSGYQ